MIIEARAISLIRGTHVLFNKLSFTVKPGETLLIQGANGSGKSSLLRLVAGLLPCTRGQINYSGVNISTDRASYQQNISYLAHKNGLSPYLNGLSQLELVLKDDLAKIYDLMDRFALDKACIKQPISKLSFGQQRKIALIRTLLTRRPIKIMDEPFTGLDKDASEYLAQLIQTQAQQGACVLLSSHQALPYETRTLIIGAGL